MSRLVVIMILIALASAAAAEQEDAPSLCEAVGDRFLQGVALSVKNINDEKSCSIAARHFNSIVAENCMKAEELHPAEDVYDFSDADRFVDFGERNGMKIIGHCLIWHSQCPQWFCHDGEGNLVGSDEMKRRMRDHIHTVVGRYKGRIHGWDVVNEAIEGDGSWRQSDFYRILGEEFIPLAFQYAHEADPEAELYYNDIFRIGVAVSDRPEGPFVPHPDPMRGSYSIDPAVFRDGDEYYMYFGGLWGGQLQRYRDNRALENPHLEPDDSDALTARVVRLERGMLQMAEEPRPVVILDSATGKPLKAGDNDRRFFEASWMHKRNGKYYFSYSTGDTHRLCYAIGDNPYGPFVYAGCILTPVVGWTTHHSIVEFKGEWYLFYHDCVPSGGTTWLRSLKVRRLRYDEPGNIIPMDGMD